MVVSKAPAATSRSIILDRIESMVRQQKTIALSQLPAFYKKQFGTALNVEDLGISKVKLIFNELPSIQVNDTPRGAVAELAYGGSENSTRQQQQQQQNVGKETILGRIEGIVEKHGSINIKDIPEIYQQIFGSVLCVKDLGVNKLPLAFVMMPRIELKKHMSSPTSVVYTAVWRGDHSSADHNKAKTTRKAPSSSLRQSSSVQLNKYKLDVEDTTVDMVTFHEALSGKARVVSPMNECEEEEAEGEKKEGTNVHTAEEVALDFFAPKDMGETMTNTFGRGLSLADRSVASTWEEGALLGHQSSPGQEAVYMNTHEPFCFAAVGVQGAGKSHTLSCVLESCLIPFPSGNIVSLKKPMTSLVLHYDDNITSICESAGLLNPNPDLEKRLRAAGVSTLSYVPKEKVVILVSPTFYKQRKAFYGDHCTVKPLLFKWRSLTADHIKRIMRINEGDNQLYVASFMGLLRNYQREAVVPDFAAFMEQVRATCNVKGQQGPLDQRIALLESLIAESDINKSLKEESLDLSACISAGHTLVLTDLTDPLLSKEEANGLFQVLTEQFRALPAKGGKLLCLDEAHKFMDGVKGDGLSEAIVNCARLMRHDGLRLAVSTQSPKALAPELLELVSVACLHHFHSHDWWTYLKAKLSLNDSAWERILSLRPGHGLVFATSHNLSKDNVEGTHVLPMQIRQRITADLGSSRRNI